jgi:DNA-binding MarR family transcriptional regulator
MSDTLVVCGVTAVAGVKVRDKRRPGHCWQDNELYDAFQPIIGPHAVNVYVHLTRECYETTAEYSLRKLADATGISKSAVSRNLAVLEHVGMLRVQRGAGSAASSCELLDLKDSAERLGAIYNRRRSSFVFTDSMTAKLRAEITALRKQLQAKTASVPQRDTNTEEKSCTPDSERDASVPLDGVLCPSAGGSHQYSEQDSILNTNPPPTPALPAGGALHHDHVDDALELVCSECGFSDERLKKALRKPLTLWMRRNTGKAYDAAAAMIAAWRNYNQLAEFMRVQWGPRKFFTQGNWLKAPQSWPLDHAMLSRRREARVGSC